MAISRAQGATEYLVLLAVVLIVALVSVALLGFFPGMASDAQYTQSQAYWQSTQPISIIETKAYYIAGDATTYPYIRFRNTGAYPIRITKVLAGAGVITTFYCDNAAGNCPAGATPGISTFPISDFFYLAPGEEKYFISTWISTPTYHIEITSSMAKMKCIDATNPDAGKLMIDPFGFEYIEYLDSNQQITKREMGAKPLIIRCVHA